MGGEVSIEVFVFPQEQSNRNGGPIVLNGCPCHRRQKRVGEWRRQKKVGGNLG